MSHRNPDHPRSHRGVRTTLSLVMLLGVVANIVITRTTSLTSVGVAVTAVALLAGAGLVLIGRSDRSDRRR